MKDKFLLLLLASLVFVFFYLKGFEPQNASLAFALIALYMSMYGIRTNTQAMVKIRNCSSPYKQQVNVNSGKGYAEFEIIVENQGVRLVDASMSLVFRGPDGLGSMAMPLKEFKDCFGDHQFLERGMVGVFGWRSYDFGPGDAAFFKNIKDIRKQWVELCVYSQRYRVARFRVGGAKDRMAWWWNYLASRIGQWTEVKKQTPEGRPYTTSLVSLPKCICLEWNLRCFMESIARLEST